MKELNWKYLSFPMFIELEYSLWLQPKMYNPGRLDYISSTDLKKSNQIDICKYL